MIEVQYEVGASKAELRELFAAEVDNAELLEAHDEPWLSRGLEPPRRSAKALRAEALAQLLEHSAQAPTDHVLTLKEAAPHLGLTERQLRHAADQGHYDDELTETSAGLRALRFRETSRIWVLPRRRGPDPRVFVMLGQGDRLHSVDPGEEFEPGYRRRRDGKNWATSW